MSEKYYGKICPYCKTPLKKGDVIAVCGVCDMPHHLSCWQENQSCTTFGCKGTIREIIGYDPNGATKPVAAPATPARPQQPQRAQQPMDVVYESREMRFMAQTPLVLENTALVMDPAKDKLFARCTFRSITDKAIRAVLVEISCKDIWGTPLGEPITYQYLDLMTKQDGKFGQTNLIELANKETRNINISVKKVLFADASVLDGGDVAFTMPAPVLLSEHLGSNALVQQYARQTTATARYVPQEGNGYWLCACGALNTDGETQCHNCKCAKEQLTEALDPQALEANLQALLAEQKAAKEKREAEQAEEARKAKEKAEREQIRQQERIRVQQARESERKKRKVLTIVAISLLATALIMIAWLIPYARYRTACDALDNKEYRTAWEMFEDLNGFLDSEDLLKEAKYLRADELQQEESYQEAYWIFTELGNYKESKDEVLVTIWMWEAQALGSESESAVQQYRDTVKLESDHYEMFYATILLYINAHPDADYWYNQDHSGNIASENVLTMLNMLPSSYKDTKTLMDLFTLTAGGYDEEIIFEDNAYLIQQCFSLDFVKDLAGSDAAIGCFLKGYWSGSGYYLSFYENDSGGISSAYDLPWVSEPYGTRYYDIRSQIYIYIDGNSNELAKVFRFEIVDYNSIKVYCYKNNRTYTLYR